MHVIFKKGKPVAWVGTMTFTLPRESRFVSLDADDMTPSEINHHTRTGNLIRTAVGYKMSRITAAILDLPTHKPFPLISETIYDPI